MSQPSAETERYLDRLYEAELHIQQPDHAEEYLEAHAARRQQQALAAMSALPAAERDRLTALLGASEGKQNPPERFAERLLADSLELRAFHEEACAGLDGSLRDLAAHARDAIANAARHVGRERNDDLRDAEKLLKEALSNPLAARNPALWFDAGWATWKRDGGALDVAEDAFYQAVRLSSSMSERFHRHALRHLAHLQAARGQGEEALSTAQRFLSADDDDPQLFLEAGRYAALAGRHAESGRYVSKAIEYDPTAISGLFADPDFAALGPARIEALENLTERLRADAERQTRRWSDALDRLEKLEPLLKRRIFVPAEQADPPKAPTATLSLLAARRVALRHREQAEQVLLLGHDALSEALDAAREDEDRHRRRLGLIQSDLNRWQTEIRAIEEEARAGNISLHPYQFENPLTPRKNQQARHMREVYASCKANLALAETAIRDEVPVVEANRKKAAAYVAELESALADLERERLA